MKVIYLHGFASGPGSRKARFFRARLEESGVQVDVPDLAEGDFENLTITGQMAVLDRLVRGESVRLIGSSMGGYLAALYAAKNPVGVDRLLLLAPAFGLADRWPGIIGEEAMHRWRNTGKLPVFHYGEQRYRDLGLAMLEDSRRWESNPAFLQPALIFHGVNDVVVPVEASRQFAALHSNARLLELDSDHELLNVLPAIWDQSKAFLMD